MIVFNQVNSSHNYVVAIKPNKYGDDDGGFSRFLYEYVRGASSTTSFQFIPLFKTYKNIQTDCIR